MKGNNRLLDFSKKLRRNMTDAERYLWRYLRDRKLKELGFKVIRFWDNGVLNNIEGVLEKIREEILSPDT